LLKEFKIQIARHLRYIISAMGGNFAIHGAGISN
jgi:hypothetical protein